MIKSATLQYFYVTTQLLLFPQDVVCSHVLLHSEKEKYREVSAVKESKKMLILQFPKESEKETFQTNFFYLEYTETKEQAQQGL